MRPSQKKAVELFRQHHGLLSASQAALLGINYWTISQLRELGVITRESRGVYRLTNLPQISDTELVVVAKRIPAAVICLISALAIHELTTQVPHQVYIALPRGVKRPRLEYPPVQVVWMSNKSYAAGVEEFMRDGVTLRVYSAAKTVTDCFKFRDKIGEDVALEALKDYLRTPGATVDELMRYARINRVANVMRPYIKAAL